jgi:PKD repeat protein
MRKITFTLAALALAFLAQAQEPAQNKCAADEVLHKELAKSPTLAAQHVQFMDDLQSYLAAHPQAKSEKAGPRIIPVVFHILYAGGSENITKAQVLDQVAIMNEDFRRLNADAANTPAAFDSVAADCNIEFVLANLDPEGKCTDGITRTYSTRTLSASNQNGAKSVIYWNRDNYLNVWVVKSIGNISNLGLVLGYAQFPLGGLTATDGIVIRSDYIGSIGSSAGNVGRTATHEIGHWLGLRHIWGDEDCGSDLVFDTPVHKEANFGCFTYPKFNTCADGDTLRGEMFMNYMDYSNDECMNMFSKGQKAIMDFVLEGPESGVVQGFRENLWSPENLANTGVVNDPPIACEPKADFFANRVMLCEGTSVTFTDNSYNGTISSRNWTFEGANTGTSTATNPTITYSTPGKFDVTLDVTNPQGTSTKTINDYIIVSSNTADDNNWGYFESFENEQWFNDKWFIFDYDNSGRKWQRIIGAAADMFHSAYVNNYGNLQGSIEDLITPSYNISNLQTPVNLKFSYSGAASDTGNTDVLKVYYSLNCGQTWTVRATYTGSELANAGLYTGAYLPPNVNYWTEKTISLPNNVTSQDNVRFKFEFTSGGYGGNNFYIDKINIANTTGVDENLDNAIGLSLFPNPLGNTIATLSFHMPKNDKVTVDVIDVLGRTVANVFNGDMLAGQQNITIPRETFGADGVYFVRFSTDGKQAMKKVIVAKQ